MKILARICRGDCNLRILMRPFAIEHVNAGHQEVVGKLKKALSLAWA